MFKNGLHLTRPTRRAEARLSKGKAVGRSATRRIVSVTSVEGRESVGAQCLRGEAYLGDFFNILLIQLHKLTLFHPQKKEWSVQGAVRSETSRSGQCRQVALCHEKVVERFAGGGAVADPFEDGSGCIISLHSKKGWGCLKTLIISLNELLHGWIRAVDEKAVHECCAVDGPVGGAGEVR